MSDLSFLEKHKLEQLLEMSSGYVLQFNNRTFREFIIDSTQLDIDDPRYNYHTNSKANRLRMFWQKEDNATVGKLLKTMIDFSNKTGPLEEECRQIVARLLNGSPIQDEKEKRATVDRSSVIRRLYDEFDGLSKEKDRNKAGLALEGLLNRLFDIFQLKPRQPFRVIGEQIDGSFELDNEIYLLESKWENHPSPEADLLVFKGKIDSKSPFTRGVFIALNDISPQARDAITRGKILPFFVMNGHDLVMILSETMSLTDFLRKRMRLLAEEGRVCVPFADLNP